MYKEFQAGGLTFRANKINAFTQFHLIRRLAPILSKLAGSAEKLKNDPMQALGALGDHLAAMKDEDADYILMACLAATERSQDKMGWARVVINSTLMFQDLELPVMLQIAWEVIQFNFSGFFSGLPSNLSGGGPNAPLPG